MSLTAEAKVSLKVLNSCMVSLPSAFIYPILDSTGLLVQNIVIKIFYSSSGKHIVSLGWNGNNSSDSNSIEIDTQYAKLLKLQEGLPIRIELDLQTIKDNSNNVNSFATSVEIEPETTADWELTEIYAQAIEINFLSQVRCVTKNQLLLIRANPSASGSSNSGSINFRVKNIKTLSKESEFALVGNNTELYIIPKPHKSDQQSQIDNNDNAIDGGSKKKHSISSKRTHNNSDSVIKRCIINPDGEDITIYNYGPKLSQFKGIEFVQISIIEGPGTPIRARKITSKELEMGLQKESFGRKLVARYIEEDYFDSEMFINDLITENSFMISPLLAISLGLENTSGETILIEPCNKKCIRLDIKQCNLNIHRLITTSDDSNSALNDGKMELKQDERNQKKIKELEWKKNMSGTLEQIIVGMYGNNTPLTNGMKLPIVEKILPEGAILEISSQTSKSIINNKRQNINTWVLLGSDELNHNINYDEKFKQLSNLEIGKDLLVPVSRIQRPFDNVDIPEIFGQDKKMDSLKQFLFNGVSTFLYGKSGSGKSLACSILEKEFVKAGYYVKLINFEQVGINDNNEDEETNLDTEDSLSENSKKENNKNKIISNKFDQILRESAWHSPSLIILENLDKVLPKEIDFGDSAASTQLTEILINISELYCKDNNITFLITSKSKDSINKTIFQKHFIDEEVGLESPNKNQLSEILQRMTAKTFPEYTDNFLTSYASDIASELEGYLPLDLENLLDRAFHHMVTESREKLQYDDFMFAIEGYTPTSLRGVKLQKATTNWSDIGGLLEVKRILLETLEWPTKYAPIFEKCTLRLRSGILLYGYPGCGKTMLASAISSQCGLNFISVKGPEILNKYIGASEQSVRELFERAQSAKPCILFFDEFDSIAPKRGHDSTGVTDRIVNQLLTQMDGAEGLEGVYVLAATSRPDLIDSALLRPGRLDKSVICDLPDYENRLDILKTITKSNGFNLLDEQSLEEVANETNGYTGADLQAVVYNAYLKGVHEKLENETMNTELDNNLEKNKKGDLEYHIIHSDNLFSKRFKNSDLNKKKIETLMENYKLSLSKNNAQQINKSNDSNLDDTIENNKQIIFISKENLKESLSETKKSISVKELEKLENIYAQFESSKRPSEMKDGEGSTEVGVRATLM